MCTLKATLFMQLYLAKVVRMLHKVGRITDFQDLHAN